jgi:hypothetical protein
LFVDVAHAFSPRALEGKPKQPVVKVWLHLTGDASAQAALLLLQIQPVFSRRASPVSVRRQTFTTGREGLRYQ